MSDQGAREAGLAAQAHMSMQVPRRTAGVPLGRCCGTLGNGDSDWGQVFRVTGSAKKVEA